MLILRKPEKRDLDTVLKAAKEWKDAPTPYDIRVSEQLIAVYEDKNPKKAFEDWIKEGQEHEHGLNLPEGHVPSTNLFLMQGDNLVGLFDVRHRLTEFLMKRGGHIAYQIVPSERRKGYCKAGLKMCLQWARETLAIEKALLSCHEDNIASHKTMLSVMRDWGGFEDTDVPQDTYMEKRVWLNTKAGS